MGRIKTTLIKRTTKELMELEEFSPDFKENKIKLGNILPSKKIRNKIAGYLTRLSHTKQKSLDK
jgi:ribosomal protein S17E